MLLERSTCSKTGRRPVSHLRRGFTIIEVALASFVLVFALAAGIVTIQAGFKNLDVARGLTLASQIAQSEIESIRLNDWSHLPSSGTINIGSIFSTDATLASRFQGTRTITDTPGKVGSMKDIQIDVTWKTYDGTQHTRTFKAVYAKYGIYDYDYTKPR